MSTCTAHNGTYACQQDDGHLGLHRGTIRFGRRRGTRYSFRTNYSPVHFTR